MHGRDVISNMWVIRTGSRHTLGNAHGFTTTNQGSHRPPAEVSCHQDEKGKYLYTHDWTFTSSDGRFEMHFKPIIDRESLTDVGIIASDQHQVFGYFNGKMILDDGKIVELKDFIGFAERVTNKW